MITDLKSNERLIGLLKRRGPQTTAELAAALEISVPAVRQHLKNLLDAQQILKSEVKNGVGRPAQLWSLTAAGHARFPDAHSDLTVALIASVRAALGDDALDDVIDHRHQESLRRYTEAMAEVTDVPGRLERLVELREGEGYMPELEREQDGSWLFVENHCPICAAAEACQGFCRSELELFRSVLGAEVDIDRVEYLITGDRRCAYRVTV